MAKKTKDQFDIFKEATLGTTSALSNLNPNNRRVVEVPETPLSTPTEPEVKSQPATVVEKPTASSEKVSKNANRELVSFHISKDVKKKLNLLKVETEKSLGDLYNEAIDDLLAKYNVR